MRLVPCGFASGRIGGGAQRRTCARKAAYMSELSRSRTQSSSSWGADRGSQVWMAAPSIRWSHHTLANRNGRGIELQTPPGSFFIASPRRCCGPTRADSGSSQRRRTVTVGFEAGMMRGRRNGLVETGWNFPLRWQLETRDELIAGNKAAVGCFRPEPLHIFVVGAFDIEHCGMQVRVAGWRGGHETAPMAFFRCLHRCNPQIRILSDSRPRPGIRQSDARPFYGMEGLDYATIRCRA
jgi:hypothetical protein